MSAAAPSSRLAAAAAPALAAGFGCDYSNWVRGAGACAHHSNGRFS